MQASLHKIRKCLFYFGATLIVIGFTNLFAFSSLLDYILSSSMALSEGSRSYEEWKITRPLTMDIYMFNWTNPGDIYDPNIKPKFEEVGPYRFMHVREKVNITWNENQTVTYKLKLHYYYVDDSPKNYSDIITTIDMISWSVAHKAKNEGFLFKESAKVALLFSHMHVRRSVRELLFDGYPHPLLSMANVASFVTGEEVPDKFGWFYGRNGSIGLDGVYNVKTNTDHEFGVLKNWNYESQIPFYTGPCAKVHGSASEFYPRHLKRNHITYFCTDMCRALKFSYESNETVRGIPSYKYSARDEVFDNGTIVKDNKCYCSEECHPSGVIDMSACRMGLPVFSSLPHFYYADPVYVNTIEGMHPEKEKHEFYFALEPDAGVITDTAARVQLNLLLEPLWDFKLFNDVPKIMFPVFWTENRVTLYDEYVTGMKILIALPKANMIFSITIVTLGMICVTYAFSFLFTNKKKSEKKLTKEEIPLT